MMMRIRRGGQADLQAVTDLGDGGPTDVSIEKDRLLSEAFAAEHARLERAFTVVR